MSLMLVLRHFKDFSHTTILTSFNHRRCRRIIFCIFMHIFSHYAFIQNVSKDNQVYFLHLWNKKLFIADCKPAASIILVMATKCLKTSLHTIPSSKMILHHSSVIPLSYIDLGLLCFSLRKCMLTYFWVGSLI